MPAAPLAPERWITDAQLYARHATVTDETGERYEARTWSEIDVVQWLARRPGARGWLVVAPDKLGEPTPYGSVAEQVARAEAAGAEVRRAGTGTVSVHVAAAVTTTLGGLAVDARGRAADGVWAAGADAGGIAAGGYASGLAGALVTGRIAAEAALAGLMEHALRHRASRSGSASRTSCSCSTSDGALAPVAAEVLARLDLPEGLAGHELFAAELELRSPPSRTAEEAVEALRARARGGRRRRRDADGRRAAPRRRVRRCRAHRPAALRGRRRGDARDCCAARPSARCTCTSGCPTRRPRSASPTACAPTCRCSPGWPPTRRSGTASTPASHSARAALVRAYPGRGVPRAYRDFGDYEHALETTLRAAGMEDRTQLWWDVRPHPRLGTVEVREMDAQTELRDVLPLAALVHCLARHEAERGSPVIIPRDALDWSSFRAARDGLDAEILDEDGRVRPLREVARTLLSRLVMVAGELDCGDALEEVERLLSEGNGADRQRAEHARSGMDGLVRSLPSARSARKTRRPTNVNGGGWGGGERHGPRVRHPPPQRGSDDSASRSERARGRARPAVAGAADPPPPHPAAGRGRPGSYDLARPRGASPGYG